MAKTSKLEAQNPLILRCHRLMEAFAKSDDERDFYIDRLEGFLIYVGLDKTQEEIDALEKELVENESRYCAIPKLSYYETKKIMEGFVNEKVYDIDTKEKLLDIIQSREARENFLEFIYDHHAELEKWQQFYHERSRIRIIEWLRQNHFHFVFEEDLEIPRNLIEQLKQSLFEQNVHKDIQNARKLLVTKAKMYYSNEALNPRPKRGRPPKQIAKPELEPQVTHDVYTTIAVSVRPFLFSPEISSTSALSVFSSKFDIEEDVFQSRLHNAGDQDHSLAQKLASIRALSAKWSDKPSSPSKVSDIAADFEDDEDDDEDENDDDFFEETKKTKTKPGSAPKKGKPAVKPKVKGKAETKPKAAITKPKAAITKPKATIKPKKKEEKASPAKRKLEQKSTKPKRIMPRIKK